MSSNARPSTVAGLPWTERFSSLYSGDDLAGTVVSCVHDKHREPGGAAKISSRLDPSTRPMRPRNTRRRSFFQAPGDTAFHDDCLLERGGLETSVSRGTRVRENRGRYWGNFASKSASIHQRMSSLSVCYAARYEPRIPVSRECGWVARLPSDELKSSKAAGRRANRVSTSLRRTLVSCRSSAA